MPTLIHNTNCRKARLLATFAVLVLVLSFLGPQTETWAQTEGTVDDNQYERMLPFPEDRITVPSWRYAGGPHVRAAFRDVVAEASRATVRLFVDGEPAALGAIVDSEGWILTKASRLSGDITCQLADGTVFDAQTVGVNRDFDLAMLKIEATQLPALAISETQSPPVGSWLASVGTGRDPIAVGVVSVPPRAIPHRFGILGVLLDDRAEQALVVQVFPESGAAQAGLQVNDIIATVDGVQTPSREQLIRTVRTYSPGDKLKLEVKRQDETLLVEALLSSDLPGVHPSRDEFQNQLGGELSQRRFGFPNAVQHDSVVEPADCGGPIVNLDGEVVGLNIARSGRTETYAIPSASLTLLIDKLKPSR